MHTVHLTPYLMKRAVDLAIRGFVVLPDHTHAPIDAISDGTTTQAILGAATRRVRVGDMTDDALASVDQRNHDHLIKELVQQGQPATMDSIVSLVTWERFATTPGALCEEFVHDRPMQSDAVYDDEPEIALERFLQPLATAKVGQPVAVSLPYDVQALPGVRDDICTSMMRVIGVGKNGFAISRSTRSLRLLSNALSLGPSTESPPTTGTLQRAKRPPTACSPTHNPFSSNRRSSSSAIAPSPSPMPPNAW